MEAHMDPESELVAASQQGDWEAFGRLIVIHQERIYGLAIRMMNNHHDAEDIVQETFLLAYRKLNGFRGKSSLGTWLYRIAVNLCLSKARKKKPLEMEEEEISRLPDHEHRSSLSLLAQAEEWKQNLSLAVAKLPPRQRMCFLLRNREDLSYREISERMGCREGTAKALHHQALRSLRNLLSKYMEDTHANP